MEKSVRYTRWACSYSKGTQQAAQLGTEELHELQPREMPRPALGEE